VARMDATLGEIERAFVAIRRRQTRRAIAGAIPTSTYEVLDAVEAAEERGAPPTVNDLATSLHVDQPRASRLVAAAVDAGLVQRSADPADSRRTRLVRTAHGRRVSRAMHRQRQGRFAAAMADWSSADRDMFATLLTRFIGALEASEDRRGESPRRSDRVGERS
jgi:DNA-binding MarR family transcriptional regulator